MLIVADENMPLVSELFGGFGEVRLLPGRKIGHEEVNDADVLLIRSVTTVDSGLIANTRLQFVGSATIGADHVDTDALAQQGIAFANAPGCNANAVAEYVIASLLEMAERKAFRPGSDVIAIVGYGNVGKRLAAKLLALNWPIVVHDPPLLASGFSDHNVKFVDKESVLQSDVITLHVPLTEVGEWATRHWISARELEQTSARLLINTCRGPVVDNEALFGWLATVNHHAVLDVWEHEPNLDLSLMDQLAIATPHIAGYSLEGKTNGSFMVLDAFCRHFRLTAPDSAHLALPVPAEFTLGSDNPTGDLLRALQGLYRPSDDDRRMRAALRDSSSIAVTFDELRKNYPVRRELLSCRVRADKQQANRFQAFASFHTSP